MNLTLEELIEWCRRENGTITIDQTGSMFFDVGAAPAHQEKVTPENPLDRAIATSDKIRAYRIQAGAAHG